MDRRAADRLLVQPVIGYLSDRTWTGLGRRRPYFLVGAVLASLALFAFPNVPALWVAAGMLWILDASINVSMEPFRAFVGDQLAPAQRPAGYAMQSFFIGGFGGRQPVAVDAGEGGVATPRRKARSRTRCAMRSTPAAWSCSARWPGRCCARANIRRPNWPRSTTPNRTRAGAEQRTEAARGSGRRRRWLLVAGVAGWFAVAGGLDKQLYVLAAASPATARRARQRIHPRRRHARQHHARPARHAAGDARLALVQFFRGSRCSRCGSTPRRR